MKDFEVCVTRYSEDTYADGTVCPTYLGSYCSKVYAIDGNKFLVYDNGSHDPSGYVGGFTWVDFTEHMIPIEEMFKDDYIPVPVVKLITEKP